MTLFFWPQGTVVGEFRSLFVLQRNQDLCSKAEPAGRNSVSVCVCVCVHLYVIPNSILFYHYVNLVLKSGQEFKGSKQQQQQNHILPIGQTDLVSQDSRVWQDLSSSDPSLRT